MVSRTRFLLWQERLEAMMIEWMVDSRRHRPSPIGASHPSHLTFIKEDAKNDDSTLMTTVESSRAV